MFRDGERILGRVVLSVCGMGLLVFMLSSEGCNCNPPPPVEVVQEVVPENTGPFPTQIRFVQPVAEEIVSGQIPIEVEVIDGDGIKEVAFIINGKPYKVETNQAPNTTKESPRYAVQVATAFLPRGVLHLTVKTIDNRGDVAEKTIQVTSRERWVAAFGVGHVEQMLVREDRHMILRLYRTEEDISRVTNPGPNDEVGSVIVTANAVGSASWVFLGIGEEYSPFALDDQNKMYLGSRTTQTGTNRLLALGAGDSSWTSEVPVKPEWETALQEWTVKSAPLIQGNFVWAHLEKPAQGPNPAISSVAQFGKADGKEVWRYTGDKAFEILRGPYLLSEGRVVFASRDALNADSGFQLTVLDSSGKSIWTKSFAEFRLNVAQMDTARQKLYIGVEKRVGDDVTESSIVCIDPSGQTECWRADSGKSWPAQIALGKNTLYATRHPSGLTQELVALQLSDGKEKWKKDYPSHSISGLLTTPDDAIIVLAARLDEFRDPVTMQVDRYSAEGSINWSHENKQYLPKNGLLSSDSEQTLWMIVRNIEDKREQLGTRLLTLNNKGERLWLFTEESRKAQFLQFFPKDILYMSSVDSRDARVHNLIAR